jgi:shikimate dehydrogenase
MTVFDMVYSPMRTPLLSAAEKAGARIVLGCDMFIHQGAEAFELWTGNKAPVDVMRRIVMNKLGEDVS